MRHFCDTALEILSREKRTQKYFHRIKMISLADEGFLRSASMILASEIGDKTFFIAAILAMNHSRLTVWSGSVFALALMTGLSAMMGAIAPNLLNKTTTHYVATGLFFLFGLRSVYDQTVGYDANAESELEEVEKELKEHTSSSSSRTRGGGGRGGKTGPATRTRTKAKKQSPGSKINDILSVFFSPIFLQAFLMTFLAEWGDRSQIATIALAADYDPIGVTLGGICGHGLCTSAAVLGGKRMAGAISERMVGLCGGILFLAFGVHALVVGE
ncbi:unnamed protein product [Bathycoccus prasinos]